MSVIMTLRVSGDPAKLEQFAAENEGMIAGIAERAKAQGLIAHRFYGSEGEIMVVDEWPDAESFQRFYESEQDQIGPMMQQVATSEPVITFWRKLETGDDVGWE
jgi:quinol monooxygenase YgiN